MFELLFTFGVLLWLTLAIAVGFHAKGHNRSGIIWFTIIVITGIFGFAFYLLAITSTSSSERKSGRELDRKIINKGPKFVLTSVVGAIAVFLVGYVWAELSVGFNPESESLVSLTMLLSFVAGAISGPYVAFNHGWRRWGYLLSYTPVLILGVMGGLATPDVVFGVSQTDLAILQRAVLGMIGAGICGFLWFQLYQKVLQDGLQSIWQKSQGILSNRDGREEMNLSRRKTLGLVGGGVTLLIGGVAYSHNPKPDLSIVKTTVKQDSEGAVIIVEMNNPRSEPVTVEIEALVQVVEINGGVTGNRDERQEFSTFVSKTPTLPAESNHQIDLNYEVDDKDRLVDLELDSDEEPSFSIENEETN